jgi:hypothetical protein
VAFVGTDVSEEYIASTIRMKGIWLVLFTLMMEAILSSKTSVLTRTTRHHIQNTAFFKTVLH